MLPVIELEPFDLIDDRPASPKGSLSECPQQWEEYNQMIFHKSGFNNLQAIETGGCLFEIAQFQEQNLKLFLAYLFEDHLTDEVRRKDLFEDMTDFAPLISGGFALKSGEHILHQPGCCCGLETIEEWHFQDADEPVQVWTGHDHEQAISLTFGLSQVILTLGDNFQFAFSEEDYQAFLENAEYQLEMFIKRSAPVLNDLFETDRGKELARAMIYR